MTAIDTLRLQAKLASAEHLIGRVNRHLVSRPDDTQMREASVLLWEAALRLRHQLLVSLAHADLRKAGPSRH